MSEWVLASKGVYTTDVTLRGTIAAHIQAVKSSRGRLWSGTIFYDGNQSSTQSRTRDDLVTDLCEIANDVLG